MTALLERLRRTTPRERLLLGLLAVGAGLYAPVAAMEWRSAQAERYVAALGDRATAQAAARASRRLAQAAADQTVVDDMNAWGFEASNAAVAQILIERRLVEAASRTGLPNPRITTNTELEAVGPTQWLEAEVQSDLRWDPTFDFIDALAAWPEGFRVKAFRYEITPMPAGLLQPGIEPPPPSGRIRILLAFPVRLPAVAAGSAAS